uniref:RE1 silencing transcription factor n=1 Tax=Xenopus tropicalis TaxID=8364 RepID=A0A803KCI6_XENTR
MRKGSSTVSVMLDWVINMATQMVNQPTGNSLFCTSTYSSISLDNDMYGLHDLSKADMAAPRLIMLANVALTGELSSGCCDYTLEGERQMAELTTVNDNSFSDSEGERLEDSPSNAIQSPNFTMEMEPAERSKEGTYENDGTLLSSTLEVVAQKDNEAPSTTEDKNKCIKSKPFRCKPCQYKAESEEEFVHHIKIHSAKIYTDNDNKKTQGKESDSNIPEESDISKGPIQCDRCGYNTNRFDHYLAHLKHHNKAGENERVYKCTICTYTTVSEYHWKKHLRNHYPRILYTCSQCSYFSDRKNNYIQHIRTHTGERPYQCIICPYSSSQKTHLTRHMRTHSGEKPFKCEQCSYVASNQHEVTRHARQVHNGPKPLTCPHCDYKTADRSNFKKHVELHVNPRQFLCPVCDYAASKKCNLQYHIKSRHSGCTNITMDVSKVKLRTKKGEVGVADTDTNKQTENGNIIKKKLEETVKAEKKERCVKSKKRMIDGQVAKKSRLSSTQKKIKASEVRAEKIEKFRKSSCVKRKADLLENPSDTLTSTVKKKKLKNSPASKVITSEIKDDIPKKVKGLVKKKENSAVKSKHKKKTGAQSSNGKRNMPKKITEQKVDKGNKLDSKIPVAPDIEEQMIVGKVANENDSEQFVATDIASINNNLSTESCGLLNEVVHTDLSINTTLETKLSAGSESKSEHVSKAIIELAMQVDVKAGISKQEKTQDNYLMDIETISTDLEKPNQVLLQNGIPPKKGNTIADLLVDSAKTTVYLQISKPTSCLLKDCCQPNKKLQVGECKPTCYVPMELCETSADLPLEHGDPSATHLVSRGTPSCDHPVNCGESLCGQHVDEQPCSQLVDVEEPTCNHLQGGDEPAFVLVTGRDEPTRIPPPDGDEPAYVPLLGGDEPACILPRGGDEPACILPLDRDEPACVPPRVGDEPACVPPWVGDEPACVPPPGVDEPACVPPPGVDEPACVPPPGVDEPACVPPPGVDKPSCVPPPGGDEPTDLLRKTTCLSVDRQEVTDLVGREKHYALLTECNEPTDLSAERDVLSVDDAMPTDLSTAKQKPLYLSKSMGSPLHVPVEWSEPFNLSMEWREPDDLSVVRVEPSDLSLRKGGTADLSERSNKPSELSVVWGEPVDLSVGRSEPADLSVGRSQPANLQMSITETMDLLEGSQLSVLTVGRDVESFDMGTGRVDPIDLSVERCEPIDLSVEKGMPGNLEISDDQRFGKLGNYYNINCAVGTNCQLQIKDKAKYNEIPKNTFQSYTKLSVEIREPHIQLQSMCISPELNLDTTVQQGNNKECKKFSASSHTENSGAEEVQTTQMQCAVSRSESIDIDEDEGIHSHDGSDISDNVSEMSYDSGLNGVPSVQKTLTSDSKVLDSSETKESFVCIFCDRTFRIEEEYTKHLKRHLVNVYYLEKAAKDDL